MVCDWRMDNYLHFNPFFVLSPCFSGSTVTWWVQILWVLIRALETTETGSGHVPCGLVWLIYLDCFGCAVPKTRWWFIPALWGTLQSVWDGEPGGEAWTHLVLKLRHKLDKVITCWVQAWNKETARFNLLTSYSRGMAGQSRSVQVLKNRAELEIRTHRSGRGALVYRGSGSRQWRPKTLWRD